jgi:hypothetical protein
VIATGFDRRGQAGGGGLFDIQRTSRDRPRRERPADAAAGRTPVFDDSERSSLEIGDDDIDVPSFLKD